MDISIFSLINKVFDVTQDQRVKQRDVLVMIGDLRGPMLEIFDRETFIIEETRKYVISMFGEELEKNPFSEKTQNIIDITNKCNLKLAELFRQYKKDQEKLLNLK